MGDIWEVDLKRFTSREVKYKVVDELKDVEGTEDICLNRSNHSAVYHPNSKS